MSRALSNKALVVLALLRKGGEWTCQDVADTIRERTPCGVCNGSGEGDDSRWGCRKCYGRGRAHFDYSNAYIALKQLVARRLVSRRYLTDEWGDVTSKLVYELAAAPEEPADDLEALFQAPSAPERAV